MNVATKRALTLSALTAVLGVSATALAAPSHRWGTLYTHAPQSSKVQIDSSMSGNLTYNGGHIISHVQVVAVYWGAGVSSSVQSTVQAFYTAITGGSYIDWESEYDTAGHSGGTNQTLSRGSFLKAVQITPANTSKSITDSDIGTELAAQISSGVLPTPKVDAQGGVDTLYVTYFPAGIVITDPGGTVSCNGGSSQAFCGYHSGFTASQGTVPFAVIPDMNQTGCNQGCGSSPAAGVGLTASHELSEAITDTEVTLNNVAWYDQAKGENGDICATAVDAEVLYQGFTVQKIFSEKHQSCTDGSDITLPVCDGTPVACKPCAASDCTGATQCVTDQGNAKYGTCIAAATCSTNAQCTTPTMPICVSGSCHACTADSQCSGATPKCDTMTGACVACNVNADCTSTAPVCAATSHTCTGCTMKADCAGTMTCDTANGHCVQCQTSADCTAPQVCDPGTNQCVGCDSDMDCKDPANPTCNTSSHTCGPAGGCTFGCSADGGTGTGTGSDGGGGGGVFGGGGGSGNGTGNNADSGTTTTTSGCAASPVGAASGAGGLAGLLLGMAAFVRRRRGR